MSFQYPIEVIIGIAVSFISWYLRTLWLKVDKLLYYSDSLKTDLLKLELKVSKEYISKEIYNEDLEKIIQRLEKIDNKIDQFLFSIQK